ncbi:hypothetical protein GUITHDRAFT_160681 [Guillardia theta CCMP2712]|uniref:RPGR-interacting protein 1 first C2 domain-containing protein n=1 Tax=Guillardia theta (strain CCMP2712) TaxID=905079 RepID=L1K200_GUITC|nr:hypothetical protein GUITHDRAFT_160681 [Guillardia theta CCMP2712]EKX54480.1 hypothetical protein GUITHDRAFT_160681 [Guillardia theta CCMP2712]|eukprot:XP_005841460.1 hypothetical protein GUITHDRAFT_160681 [Guillardia theta CCMP2712]
MSKSEQLKMIETLKIELQRFAFHASKANTHFNNIRATERLNIIQETALLDAEEETLILSIQVDRLKTELAKIKSRGVDLVHQQQILELRKDEHEKLNQHVQDLRDEIESLEAQNSALRQNAFSAGHVKVHARVLGGKVQELNEELVDIRNLIEVDGEESIARLKAAAAMRLFFPEKHHDDDELCEKNSQPKMNDKSALEAKRLAQRSGTPLYLRKQGSSESDESTALSQEVRRLTLENNWQRRETNKLKEMLRLQEPLELHRSRLSNRESKEEEKLRQVHMKKVTYLQRKILQVQDRIDQMKEVVTHSRSDSTKQKGLGRAIFAIDLQGLEIDRHLDSIMDTADLLSPQEQRDVPVLRRGGWRGQVTLLVQFGDPVNGCNPQVKMRRDLEVVVDDMLIEFLYSEKLLVHLINVQGTDFEIIASGAVSMNDFVFKVGIAEVSYDKLPLRNVNGTTMATVNLNVSLLGDISRMASQFQASLSSSPTIKQSKIKSVVGLESRSVSFDKSKFGAVQRKVSVMFQVLDFPVAETRTVPIIEGSKSSSFDDETKSFPIPTDSSWNQRTCGILCAGQFRQVGICCSCGCDWSTEFVSDDYIGSCRLSLAPLFSKRGLHSDLKIRDSHSQRGVLEVEVSWEEEPLHAGEQSRRLSKATFLHAICFPTHAVGDKRECPICKQGKREAVAERTSDLSGDALSLHIRQVKCMDALLREDSIKELALRVLCLRGKLDKVDSEPFDNRQKDVGEFLSHSARSNVAGGFVAVGKTWGSSEKERLRLLCPPPACCSPIDSRSMKKMLQEERSMEEQVASPGVRPSNEEADVSL